MVPKRNTEECMHLITPKLRCLDFFTWVVGLDYGGDGVGRADVQSSCGELSPAASTRFGVLGASTVEPASRTWSTNADYSQNKIQTQDHGLQGSPWPGTGTLPVHPLPMCLPHWPLPSPHCAAGLLQWLYPAWCVFPFALHLASLSVSVGHN